ncbi:MAG TPA: DUF2461 domain-containing protein [Nocardioidaceae bacterium]|nr:DUF2461 domain-containing protein [Nocardioidaceae bacterium]
MTQAGAFTGFPKEALDFYDDLEMDNTKSFWTAHKDVYDSAVKGPMTELTRALEDEFGPAKIFRPYRDVRFAKDKTPYKEHQGAYVSAASGSGWYVQISAAGVYVGVGYYHPEAAALSAIRAAIADDRRGKELEKLVNGLTRKGWTLGGEKLKTTPKGYAADHPRIELLRHKSLTLTSSYGFEDFIHTPALLTRVRKDWRAARPFVEWVGANS